MGKIHRNSNVWLSVGIYNIQPTERLRHKHGNFALAALQLAGTWGRREKCVDERVHVTYSMVYASKAQVDNKL